MKEYGYDDMDNNEKQCVDLLNTEYKNDNLNIVANSWLFVIRLQHRTFYFDICMYSWNITANNVERF